MSAIFRSEFFDSPSNKLPPLNEDEKKLLKRHAVLFVNGELKEKYLSIDRVRQAGLIIAVDGGILHCFKFGIEPHEIVGDLDSSEHTQVNLYRKNPNITIIKKEDQDTTDLEYVLKNRIDWKKIERVTILGGLGGRSDHLFTHMHIIAQFPSRVFLDSCNEFVFALSEEKSFSRGQIHTFKGQTISFFPLMARTTVNSKNLKWELDGYPLALKTVSQSNESIGDSVTIEVTAGTLIGVVNKKMEKKNKWTAEGQSDSASVSGSTSTSGKSQDDQQSSDLVDEHLSRSADTPDKNPLSTSKTRSHSSASQRPSAPKPGIGSQSFPPPNY